MADTDTGAPPRVLIVIAAALALALAAAVAVFGLLAPDGEQPPEPPTGPLALVPVPAPDAGGPACAGLLDVAPRELTSKGDKLARRELAQPAPPATAAWGGGGSGEAVVLRCGLERPNELTRTSQLKVINNVQWLQVPGAASSTWYAVDREVYVALTVPDDAGTGPLQEVSNTIADALPPQPLRFQ